MTSSTWTSDRSTCTRPSALNVLHFWYEVVCEHIWARTWLFRSSTSRTGSVSSRGRGRLIVVPFRMVAARPLGDHVVDLDVGRVDLDDPESVQRRGSLRRARARAHLR